MKDVKQLSLAEAVALANKFGSITIGEGDMRDFRPSPKFMPSVKSNGDKLRELEHVRFGIVPD